MSPARPVLALCVGIGLAAVLLEAGARLLEPGGALSGLASSIGERVDDPVLEYRTLPGTGENDEAGYRNAERPVRAEVVALGDSQTWGVNAERDETWPAQLADRSGLSVYNMGRGGYGAVQYLHQLDEALRLDPDWVVVALYLGNDVYDAYSLVYSRPAHERLRHPDEGVRDRITSSDYPDLQAMFFDRVRYGESQQEPGWLLRSSALLRMIARASGGPADAESDRAWAAAHPTDGFVYDDGTVSTVFHTSYRLAAVDSRLPRVREGLRITLGVLDEMNMRVREAGRARLLFLVLPTKERVFAKAAALGGVSGTLPESHVRGVREEGRIARGLALRMEQLGIAHLDLLPTLEAAVARGEMIFPPNVDGHFTPLGYQRIAEAVSDALAGQR